ncbi:hypothetical protein KR093_001352, partial [Drosophila rubida]
VTLTTKVLAIGDSEESSAEDKRKSKYKQHNFQDDFRTHLAYILVGTRSPIDVVEDWNAVWRFSASVHNKDKHVRRYRFHYVKGNDSPPGTIISGPVISGQEAMDHVRKQLSEENWVSENEIETPLKTYISKKYYNCDQYIQHIVSNALGSQSSRLFKYLLHLHRECVRD